MNAITLTVSAATAQPAIAPGADLRPAWEAAIAAYSEAKQDTSVAGAAHDAAEGTDAFPAIEAEYWRKVDAQSQRGDELIRTPAPDASAAAIKLQVAQLEHGETLPGWAFAEVYADLRRIGGKVTCDEWARLVAAEREAFAAMMQSDDSEAATDRWAVASNAMMSHPAPDLAALRLKLDRLFPSDEDGGSTNSWAWRYAGQTIRDIRRLLPGGAE